LLENIKIIFFYFLKLFLILSKNTKNLILKKKSNLLEKYNKPRLALFEPTHCMLSIEKHESA
jgi:hypothetical protein